MKHKLIERVIFLFPILIASSFLMLKVLDSNLYINLIQEDTYLEYTQAIFYLLTFIISSLVVFRYLRKKEIVIGGLFLMFSLTMLFVFLEEISWGQRIFDFESPEYFEEHNDQNELTIHNLKPFMKIIAELYIVIAFIGTFGWYLTGKLRDGKAKDILLSITPKKHLMFYFLPALLVYSLLEWLLPFFETEFGLAWAFKGDFFVWRDQEPAEFILSLGFLLFAINVLSDQKKLSE